MIARYGAGARWLNERHPGSSPRWPLLPGLIGTLADVGRLLRRRRLEAALFRAVDGIGLIAHNVGYRASNRAPRPRRDRSRRRLRGAESPASLGTPARGSCPDTARNRMRFEASRAARTDVADLIHLCDVQSQPRPGEAAGHPYLPVPGAGAARAATGHLYLTVFRAPMRPEPQTPTCRAAPRRRGSHPRSRACAPRTRTSSGARRTPAARPCGCGGPGGCGSGGRSG